MEYSELGDMKSFSEFFQADETSSLQSANTKSDSFTVEMDRFSDFSSKNVSPNSRITLQRNLSKKGSYRGEKKMNLNADNDKDATNFVPISSSPRAAQLVDSSTPEKPILVTVGATNHLHHQITITTPATTTATTESKLASRRNSFKRSSFTIDPRRMLLFFATMSSMGTILLIYLTLSMKNVGGDVTTTGQ